MNILSWLLSLSVLILLMIEAVDFQRATVCRQKAWLLGTELLTQSTLSKAESIERRWHAGCRLTVERNEKKITWKKLPQFKEHSFDFNLKGHL